jgi:hypothetical protein
MQNTLLHKTYHGKYLFTHLAIWRTFLENPETKMKQLGHYCQQVAQKHSDLQDPTHQPVLITFYETQFQQCIIEIILLNPGTSTTVTWQTCQILGQK